MGLDSVTCAWGGCDERGVVQVGPWHSRMSKPDWEPACRPHASEWLSMWVGNLGEGLEYCLRLTPGGVDRIWDA